MVVKQMFALFEVWNSNEDKAKTKFTDYRKPNLHLKRYYKPLKTPILSVTR